MNPKRVEKDTVRKNNENDASSTARIALLVVFILVPLANYVIPVAVGGGDRFADDPQTRVAAAGYAFAIWGVIFIGMIGFSAYLLFRSESASEHLRRAIVYLIAAGIASILFVPISIYGNQLLGWLDILAHLIPLVLAWRELRAHSAAFPSDRAGRWWFFGPSMYLGWISAATVISTALMANELGIEIGNSMSTAVAVAVVVVLAAIAARLTWRRDPVYGLTVCWALIAVGVEQAAYPPIRYTAWAAAGLLGLAVLYQFSRSDRFYAMATGA